MATDNTVGGLYMRLGLSLDELETDFIAAEKTTRENLARLNRESNLIRLRAEVEIGNLDSTADAMQILTVRENALNQQMAIQRDRVRLAEAAYNDLIERHGQEAVVSQRAATALERERLSLQRLERELREVTEAQEGFNSGQNDSSENSGGLSDLSEMLQSMPIGKFAAIGAGIAAIGTAANTAISSVQEMTEKFRELETQAYELNMPVNDTENFLRHMRLAGGDIGDFEGYIRGITDAYVKGEFDDPEFIALEKYGAKIVDATGKLKNFQEITEEVYQAWKKADAAGEGIEFLQLTGGEAGVRDAIQYFKRYEEAKQDAAKIFDAGLDPDELHEAERALNLLSEQMDEFKDAAANIITPFAIDAAEKLFEIFHSGTEYLVENKTAIQDWGRTLQSVISASIDGMKSVNNPLMFGNNDIANSALQSLITGNFEKNKQLQREFKDAYLENTVSMGKFRQETDKLTESIEKLDETEKKANKNPLNQYDTKRITAFRDELEDLRLEMEYADDEFGFAKAQNKLWFERNTQRVNFLSDDERKVLEELYNLKNLDIDQKQKDEIEKRTQDYLQSAADIEYSLTHSAFEKQLYDIERWKDAQLEKSETAEETAAIIANAAAKEADAFQREMDRIQGRIESAQDKLFRLTHSQRDYDLYQAQKEYYQYLKDGVPEELAKQVYNATVRDIQDRARNDKGGSYTKSKSGSSGSPYIIEFDKPKEFDWSTANAKDLAFGVMRQKNQELADSVQKVIGANDNLTQSFNNTAQSLNKAAYTFDYIEGDRIVSDFYSASQKMLDAQNKLANAPSPPVVPNPIQTQKPTNKTSDDISFREMRLNDLPNFTEDVVKSMLSGNIQKMDGAFASDNAAIVSRFTNTLTGLGLSNEQAFSYLEKIHTLVEQSAQNSDSETNEHIAENITSTISAELEKAVQEAIQQSSSAEIDNNTAQYFSDSAQKIVDAQNDLSNRINETSQNLNFNYQAATDNQNNLKQASEAITTALQNAEKAISALNFQSEKETVSKSLQELAQTFSATSEKISQLNFQTPVENKSVEQNKIVNTALDATQTVGQAMTLGGMATGNIPVATIGTTIDILSDIASKLNDNTDFSPSQSGTVPQIQALDIQPIITEVQLINRHLEQMKPQQPNITVSPNITVDLGGAYVFDNEMKRQLTDDITNEVVSAVTDAVQQAKSNADYGYGN